MDPEYYYPKKHHKCMFCGTAIARLRDGKLYPLGNKAHILLEKQTTGLYVINCCGGCAMALNLQDQDILDKIHENVVKCMELQDQLSGLTLEQAQANKSARDADSPVVGFHAIETDVRQRPRLLKRYKDYLSKKKEQ